MIKAVIFDIDDTLYSYVDAHKDAFAAVTAYAEKNLKISAKEFAVLHKETNEEIKALLGECAAIHNRLIRYQNICEKLGKPIFHGHEMYQLYWNTLVEKAKPTKGAEAVMKTLKAKGITIGIGTDMTARMQFVKLEKLGLLQYVDFMVSSEEAGAEKPSNRMFLRCQEKAKALPEECMFVGDSLRKDALGAAAFGMKGVWFCPEGTDQMPDCDVITELGQILTLL